MTSGNRQQVEEIFHRALEQEPAQRDAFVREACRNDSGLRREVVSLLENHDKGASGELWAAQAAAQLIDASGSLQPGQSLGPYRIDSFLAAGGMGEVYRATDTRLHRDVAIKVSAARFSERFEREARVIASLNHPHICHLYDVGPNHLVMEFVDGAPLKGPLPVGRAIEYARQILDALDAAHRKGITHRDLKPGNVLLTKTGVKLLDFGLAKRDVAKTSAENTDATKTMAIGLTQAGVVVGTPQYMSPEQVEGMETDARSDIFSFGAVAYELITGKKAFEGKTAASVMAAVLRETPASMTTLVPMTPPPLDRIVQRCLEKDPDDRWQTARDVMHALEDLRMSEAGATVSKPAALRAWMLAAAVLTVIAAVLGIAYWTKLGGTPAFTDYRLAVTPPAGLQIEFGNNTGASAISPDGRTLAFVAGDSIWLRPLNASAARKVPGTERAFYPFWSPDSKYLGFFVHGKLRRANLAMGTIEETNIAQARGGTWSAKGVILLSSTRTLYRISAGGGQPEQVTKLDASRKETAHYWPSFLPDNDHYLYSIRSVDAASSGIYVGSLRDPALKTRVLTVASNAIYAAASNGHPGYLMFCRDGRLFAQPFDPDTLKTTGDPVMAAESVGYLPNIFLANFSVSSVGSLVLGGASAKTQMTWLDRKGKKIGTAGSPEYMESPRLSPDASRVALERIELGGVRSLWVFEFSRGILSQVADRGAFPAWSSDGHELVYMNFEENTVVRRKYGSNSPGEVLSTVDHFGLVPIDWSPDGKYVVYTGRADLFVLALHDGERKAQLLKHDAIFPRFSPDGKWIAYTAGGEVFVEGFPEGHAHWQVSQGGAVPRWRRDGKELYYLAGDSQLTAVTVKESASGLAFEPPRALFPLPGAAFLYDVAPDGQRILALLPPEGEKEANELTVLTDWRKGLR